MKAVVSAAAEAAHACGVDATADGAMWAAFSAVCLFDCVDVFVARLEGSPCAPYEFIGELIERTSLFYFYGTSVRVQELALLGVVEKLLLGAVLLALPNGWRWRLIPTAISNVLRLMHFAASMCSQSTPYAIYPLVHVMSMALLAVSLAIVLVTVAVLSLARLVDRLGFARRVALPPPPLTVALYDRRGVFQGVSNDGADDDALLELAADMPIVPDLRRDFSVEILDLAAACLQQFSTQIRSTGLARPCGAVRLPKTTALDEYVNHVVTSSDYGQSAFLAENEHSHSGFAAFVEDEPTALGPASSNSFGLAHVLNDTRANSVRRLSLGVWALIAALGHYALERKMGSLDPAAVKGRRRADKLRRLDVSGPELADYCIDDDADDDASSDYDFICAASDTSDASDDELEPDGLVGETAALVADILSGADDDLPADRLAAAVAFMAHSLVDTSTGGPAVMTRSMYTRQMTHAEASGAPLLGTLAGLYQNDIVSTTVAAPFARSETDALAQLIHSRRTAEPRGDDTRSLETREAGDARVTLTEKTQRAQMEWRQGRAGQMRLREQLKEPSLAGWQRRKIELKLKLGADGWEPEKKIATSSMEKIRLLNSEFPKEWTIKHLSEQFKISQESVRRILKSKFQSSEEHTEQREHQRKLKIRAFKRSEKGGSK
ncbi:Required for respiratory growth protein 9 mitochondrial [Coemansia sp. RSA 355]|nr:Required for respiratory growth protein 9 mitochondrial [Coemansia sp. RSA 355]